MGMPLGIDFSLIFLDFGRQVGAKVVLKIDQKSIQQGHQKKMGKNIVLRPFWRRPGPFLDHHNRHVRLGNFLRGNFPRKIPGANSI